MTLLYRPTLTVRRTLVQEARIILDPDPDAPKGSHRDVQVTVPGSPTIYVAADVPIQRGFNHDGVGPDRNYKLPSMAANQVTKFKLLPQQFLVASCEPGLGYVSLIIEYIQG